MDAIVVAVALASVVGCVYVYDHVKDVRYRVLNAFVGQRAILGVQAHLGRIRWVNTVDVQIQDLHGGRSNGWISVEVLDAGTLASPPFPPLLDQYETVGIPIHEVLWLRRPEGDEEWNF